jgi:P2-related tail formation protein
VRITDITPLIPSFLLADRNGYALAKAIEKAAIILTDTIQAGVDAVLDVDKMPEWRLDEMAWEYNCLYDYNADIEAKRHWIRDVTPLYAVLGTPQAVYNFLEGYFDQIELEEYWQYAGKPFHFRVTVSGEWNDANEAWLRRTIAESKNVRSVLDDIALGSGTTIIVSGEGDVLARYGPPLTGDGLYAGTYPEESIISRIADDVYVIATRETKGHVFPYPQAGTQPEETTVGGLGESRITAAPVAEGHVFPYPATSEEAQAGTRPEVNTIGAIANTSAQTGTDGKATAFSYSPCTDENLCGSDEI